LLSSIENLIPSPEFPQVSVGLREVHQAELLAWRALNRMLRVDVEQQTFSVPVCHTTSPLKVAGVQHLVNRRVGPHLPVKVGQVETYEEPHHHCSRFVALSKARAARKETGHPAAGADTNFWFFDAKRGWTQQFKRNRDGKNLSEQQLMEAIEQERRKLVRPHEEELRFAWDVSLAVVGQEEHVSSCWVVTTARPFSSEQFYWYINEAIATNTIENSCSGGPLIETVCNLHLVEEIGFVPFEFLQQFSTNVSPWMQKFTPHLGKLAIDMVRKSVPLAVEGMRRL